MPEFTDSDYNAVAIIGQAGRFPGANDVDALWEILSEGRSGLQTVAPEHLRAAGLSEDLLDRPGYVAKAAAVADVDCFDAAFFGIAPSEAIEMDPQQRLLLECAYHALESAGYPPRQVGALVGTYVSVKLSGYYLHNLYPYLNTFESLDDTKVEVANSSSYAATRVAHALNLKGPAQAIDTACSSSLVAVHTACRALLNFECDMALAGGANLSIPQDVGYWYREDGIQSASGVCRAFDAEADGTVFGNAVGVVTLKRYADAVEDRDNILAVIRGTAVNNDGDRKVGFWAPSVKGQSEVIATALDVAGVDARDVTYVEAHGTGTPLGDPIELMALTEVYQHSLSPGNHCALASVKTNIGHLEVAAGITGLIKMTQSLRHGQIPPSLHCRQPNPKIDWEHNPFYVCTELQPFPAGGSGKRIGAVSSFGIGGTNAHAIVGEAPARPKSASVRPQLWPVSAATSDGVERALASLKAAARRHDLAPVDVAYTLQTGRERFDQRLYCVVNADGVPVGDPAAVRAVGESPPRIAFLFPGQGSQYPSMLAGLWDRGGVFRETLSNSFGILTSLLGRDAETLWRANGTNGERAAIYQTEYAQPLLFAVSHALACHWEDCGIQADAMLGHSLGEYVAACLAGVMTLEEALQLLVARGRHSAASDPGGMLSLALDEAAARSWVGSTDQVALAAINAPGLVVVSGPAAVIDDLAARAAADEVPCQRLATDRAFHSPLLNAAADGLRAVLRNVRLKAPQRTFISNVTGRAITADEATDPEYWVRHLLSPVRFAEGMAALRDLGICHVLEVGPGTVLSQLARQNQIPATAVAHSAQPAKQARPDTDEITLLDTVGQLWQWGLEPNWEAVRATSGGCRVGLPGYPFTRTRYWRNPPARDGQTEHRSTRQDATLGLHVPTWRRLENPPAADGQGRWLVFTDAAGLLLAAVSNWREPESAEIMTVAHPGAGVVADQKAERRLDGTEATDFADLFASLSADRMLPDTIIFGWGMTAAEDSRNAEAAYWGLVALGRALAEWPEEQRPALRVVLSLSADVLGDEPLEPAHGMLAALARVLACELALDCRVLDVAPESLTDSQAGALIPACLAASAGERETPLLAFRGRTVWRQGFEPMTGTRSAPTAWPSDGRYLLLGGSGCVGRQVAAVLLRDAAPAELVMVGRRQKPDLSGLRAACETANCHLRYVACDLGDAQALEDLLRRLDDDGPAWSGVIHAAGLRGEGSFAQQSDIKLRQVLAPKCVGTDVILRHYQQSPPGFIWLFASLLGLTGMPGQAAYAAANHYQDLAARRARRKGLPVVAIDWDSGRGTGMAARRSTGPDGSRATDVAGESRVVEATASGFRHWLPADDWWVADHQLLGHPVVPGTGFVEWARAAAASRWGAVPLRLSHIQFFQFLAVPEDGRSVWTNIESEDADGLTIVIASEHQGCRVEYARLQVARLMAATPGEATPEALIPADFDPYALADYGGFGPHWQTFRAGGLDQGIFKGRFELPRELAAKVEANALHPGLLDSAAGLVPGLALLRQHRNQDSSAIYLPVGYDSIEIHSSLPGTVISTMRPREMSAQRLVLDGELRDTEGVVRVVIRGLTMDRFERSEVAQALTGVRSPSVEDAMAAMGDIVDPARLGGLLQQIRALPAQPQVVITRAHVEQRLEELHAALRQWRDQAATHATAADRPDFTPPETPMEQTLAAIWRELLGVESVGRDDHFFQMGGHSLMATQLGARLRSELSLGFPLEALFETPTLRGMAAMLTARQWSAGDGAETTDEREEGVL